MHTFYRLFDIAPSTKIIDIGGHPSIWQLAEKEKLPMPQITIVNLFKPGPEDKLPGYINDWVVADGRHLPFGDFSFDIVFCNSVIEHLNDLGSQRLLADEIRRVAPAYFIETPNKYFFIEPHLIAPFIHWLPRGAQKALIRNFTLWGLITRPSRAAVERFLDDIRLLTEKEIKGLFPDGNILLERFMFFPKDIISYRKLS